MEGSSYWKPGNENESVVIESGITTREEFEKIQKELGMVPNTLFEKRDRKFLSCRRCRKETIHKRIDFEWQCQNCHKKE